MAGKGSFGAGAGAGAGGIVEAMAVEEVGVATEMITIISVAVRKMEVGEKGRANQWRKSPGRRDLCSDWTTCRKCPSRSWQTKQRMRAWKTPVD
jgi:hypothetical protein